MYYKIMVPLDGSELAECVLPHVEAFILQWRVRTIVFVRVLRKRMSMPIDLDDDAESGPVAG